MGTREDMPSMEEMIKACEEKVTPNEVIVFGLGVGRLLPKFGMRKAQERAIKRIMEFDGFIGVHPVDVWHNLLLFETLNDAKAARNVLRHECPGAVGQVVPLMIPKEHYEAGKARCTDSRQAEDK